MLPSMTLMHESMHVVDLKAEVEQHYLTSSY